MVISKTSSTHTAQGIYVEHLKKDKQMSNNKKTMEQLKELMTISWRQGFMNGLLAGSIICAIISTLIITIVL